MTAARREPRVVVLGGGSWGTTVASIAARRSDTLQWVRSAETAEDINERHRNMRYLGDEVELTPSLKATNDFQEAADCADVSPGPGTLGQIVTILMRSPQHKHRPLADLEWFVLPALSADNAASRRSCAAVRPR